MNIDKWLCAAFIAATTAEASIAVGGADTNPDPTTLFYPLYLLALVAVPMMLGGLAGRTDALSGPGRAFTRIVMRVPAFVIYLPCLLVVLAYVVDGMASVGTTASARPSWWQAGMVFLAATLVPAILGYLAGVRGALDRRKRLAGPRRTEGRNV